jgi:2-dehydro-3-deoxygalactonokinase
MKLFFSCDWGTSAFRLRLVDAETLQVLSEIKTDHGIALAFELWKQTKQPEEKRIAFYQTYLFIQVKKITTTFTQSFHNIPVILSGMASSTIGMLELPYKELPFQCNGGDLIVHTIQTSGENAPHKIIMISGTKSESDVMRGEETILVGCNVSNDDRQQLFILPGTHSKHIIVKDGLVTDFKTYMTGEFFDLLSKKSILTNSVQEGSDLKNVKSSESFAKGVTDSEHSSLLHTPFLVRTNYLFNKFTKEENYYYLSGLLIGTELRDIKEAAYQKITLAVNEVMKPFYISAFQTLGMELGGVPVEAEDAGMALIKGQIKIWNSLETSYGS